MFNQIISGLGLNPRQRRLLKASLDQAFEDDYKVKARNLVEGEIIEERKTQLNDLVYEVADDMEVLINQAIEDYFGLNQSLTQEDKDLFIGDLSVKIKSIKNKIIRVRIV